MTQPYGQQPGQQPGGGYPQSGGYPQAQGYPQTPGQGQPVQGYPQSPPYGQPAPGYPQTPPPGYPQQAPAYGSMPAAPPEYSSGPISRPGVATAAAVLAFVQAGITAIPGVLQLVGAIGNADTMDGATLTEGLIVSTAVLIGTALLIIGGVQLLGGKSRAVLIAGAALELAICAYYIIMTTTVDSEGLDVVDVAKGVMIGFAIFFAVMPTVSLILSVGASTTQFLQSRRGH